MIFCPECDLKLTFFEIYFEISYKIQYELGKIYMCPILIDFIINLSFLILREFLFFVIFKNQNFIHPFFSTLESFAPSLNL
jgi:hypothetical protein